jgi:hypothetical protein
MASLDVLCSLNADGIRNSFGCFSVLMKTLTLTFMLSQNE